MKKLLHVLFVFGALMCLSRVSQAGQIMNLLFSTTGTYMCQDPVGAPIACDLNGYYRVSVQVTCSSGPCTGELDMQQRNSPNDPWGSIAIPFVNPGANDLGYSNIGFGQVQFVTNGAWSGTARISVVVNK